MSKLKVVVVKEDVKKVLGHLAMGGQVQVIDVMEDSGDSSHTGFLSSPSYLEKFDAVVDLIESVDDAISKLSLPPGQGTLDASLGDVESIGKKVKPLLSEVEEIIASILEASSELDRARMEARALTTVIEFGVSSHWLSGTKKVIAVAGVIDETDIAELRELLTEKTGEGFALLSGGDEEDPGSSIIIITTDDYKKEVERLLENVKFTRSYVSDPKVSPGKELAKIKEKSKRLAVERAGLEDKLAVFAREKGQIILSVRESLEYEKKLIEAALLLGKTKTANIMNCWAPSKMVPSLVLGLEELTGGAVHVTEEKPQPTEMIPVMLDNPSLIKPFEAITKSYGLPGYYEVDPTLFMAVSFPLIFGMMFGDVGHGFVILALGYALSRMEKMSAGLRDFARIFAYCGLTSMFFGFLYGSVFGLEDVLTPIWFSPIHHLKEGLVKELIGLSLFVGFVQMLLGIIIDAVNKAYSFGLSKTVLGSVGRVLLFFGVAVLIMKLFGFPVPIISALMGVSEKTLLLAGFAAPVAFILLEEVSHSLHASPSLMSVIGAVGSGLLESFESITMFLSNLMSYSRIIILALIHAMLSEVVFMIGHLVQKIPFIGFIAYYGVVFIGSVALILGLEGLVVYVHTIRLHFYEWFTKFYGGGGMPYTPFKLTPRYVTQEKN